MGVLKVQASTMSIALQKAKQVFDDDPVILNTEKINVDGQIFFELTLSGKEKVKKEDVAVKENTKKIIQLVTNIENKRKNLETIDNAPKTEIASENYNETNSLYSLIKDIYNINCETLLKVSKKLLPYYKSMINQGISEEISLNLIESIKEEAHTFTKDEIKQILYALIHDNMNVSKNLYTQNNQQRVVVLTGTSGVGKTTTLAKIASESKLAYNKKVALFTFDIYKASTIEQLKNYSNLLKIPFEIIHSKDELDKKIAKYSTFDLILIDTEGINIFDDYQFYTLKNLLDFIPNLEKHLVLSGNIKEKDMIRIYKRFKTLELNYLIFSKIDESIEFGSIFNMSVQTDLPISFLTNGTHIPGDLITATKNKLAQLLTKAITDDVE